jgi:hypothetical protein
MSFWASWAEFTSVSTRKKLLGRIQQCQQQQVGRIVNFSLYIRKYPPLTNNKID